MSVLELKYYKTNQGLIISNAFTWGNISQYRFNETDKSELIPLIDEWFLLKGHDSILKVDRWLEGKSKIDHWKLIDDSLANGNTIPLKMLDSEVESYKESIDDGYFIAWSNHKNIRPLYDEVKVYTDGYYEDIPFKATCIGSVEGDITKPVDTKFNIIRSNSYDTKPIEIPIGTIVKYSEIDLILTPKFALHMKECALTHQDSYNIVRSFILDNIDNQYARVSSNYDFCLSVNKIIKVKPIVADMDMYKDIPTSKRPKFTSKKHSESSYEVYSVAPKAYQSYSVIKPFTGNNLEDLVKNIKLFLNELITEINTPHYACECCGGVGYTK